MKNVKRIAAGLACLTLFAVVGCQPAARQWKEINLKNELIAVQVVSEIGGRVLQYRLGDHDYFWVNKDLAGSAPPRSGLGPKGEWLNYGGDKVWPAPQGWDNAEQWPGPPDAVLDGGPYEPNVTVENGRPVAVQVTSKPDVRSGIQFSRVFRIFEGTTRVNVEATMKNIDTKPRRWGIWAVTQFDTSSRHGSGYNENFRAYCPINAKSVLANGYRVLYGAADNPTFKPDAVKQMMRAHFANRVGKIGMDSSAGWVATVDETDGYAFVHRFTYEQGKEYPDNSTVEFWSNGLGEFTAWGKVNRMPDNVKENPYLLETEILSPFAALVPGESYTYKYQWYAAKIPAGAAVREVCDAGVTCEALTAWQDGEKVFVKGSFGVFYDGFAAAVAIDEGGKAIGNSPQLIPISPLKALTLEGEPQLNNGFKVAGKAAEAVLFLYDKNKKLIGAIGRAGVVAQPG